MMRRVAIAVAAALVSAACGGGSAAPVDSGDTVTESTDADRLPDVDLTALSSGVTSSLAGIEGPAVVNLWATWCTPCRAEIPDFEEVHRTRGDEVRFIGVNVGDDADDALEFIDEVGATYEQFSDYDGDVSVALRATAMPMTVVVDGDGLITTRHLGQLDQEGLNEAIDQALDISEN